MAKNNYMSPMVEVLFIISQDIVTTSSTWENLEEFDNGQDDKIWEKGG